MNGSFVNSLFSVSSHCFSNFQCNYSKIKNGQVKKTNEFNKQIETNVVLFVELSFVYIKVIELNLYNAIRVFSLYYGRNSYNVKHRSSKIRAEHFAENIHFLKCSFRS